MPSSAGPWLTDYPARLLGPAVAGLVIGRYGVTLAFFLNGLSFLAIICALMAIRAEGLPRTGRRSRSWAM